MHCRYESHTIPDDTHETLRYGHTHSCRRDPRIGQPCGSGNSRAVKPIALPGRRFYTEKAAHTSADGRTSSSSMWKTAVAAKRRGRNRLPSSLDLHLASRSGRKWGPFRSGACHLMHTVLSSTILQIQILSRCWSLQGACETCAVDHHNRQMRINSGETVQC